MLERGCACNGSVEVVLNNMVNPTALAGSDIETASLLLLIKLYGMPQARSAQLLHLDIVYIIMVDKRLVNRLGQRVPLDDIHRRINFAARGTLKPPCRYSRKKNRGGVVSTFGPPMPLFRTAGRTTHSGAILKHSIPWLMGNECR